MAADVAAGGGLGKTPGRRWLAPGCATGARPARFDLSTREEAGGSAHADAAKSTQTRRHIMADRNRYNRRGRYQDWNQRDDRSWRDQEEQFSGERRGEQPDYEEGYGNQMSEPYGRGYGQRQNDYETGWDRDARYRQGGTGYGRQSRDYSGEGEYNYGPARYDTSPAWRGGFFTMNDQNGRDYNSRTGANYGAYGDYGAPGYPGYGGFGAYGAGATYGYGETGGYAGRRDYERGSGGRNRRDWWDRTSDEVMSWFGDEDAARRRRMDNSGRGPANYTRSDDRIREDVNDALTDDWAVDASNVTVTVNNGDVTLDGTVSTRLQKRRAEDCAEDVSGVKNVQNNLRVQEQSSTWDRTNTQASKTEDTNA
jgi:osmotically-inducible protein OsmY